MAATSSEESSGVVAFRMDRAGVRRLAQPAVSEKERCRRKRVTKAALLDSMRRAASALPAYPQSRPDEQLQVDFVTPLSTTRPQVSGY